MRCSIQLSAERMIYFQKELGNYSSNIMEIYISRLELQRCFLEVVISFSKIYIWDLGAIFG
jgi:hypothetical protein